MEDLSRSYFTYKPFFGIPKGDVELCFCNLSKLHARFWGKTDEIDLIVPWAPWQVRKVLD
jgi:hypothetical protein